MATFSSAPLMQSNASWLRPPDVPPSHYLDNRIYTSESIFAAEQEQIFRKTWKFACHESEIATRGRYRVVELAGVSIVLVRASDDTVRAFHNVCAHRGAQLVRDLAGTLEGERFRCFYHHWTYATSGNCIGIPRSEAYRAAGVEKDQIALRSVRCETAEGLVFINLNDEAEPLQDFLGTAIDQVRDPLSNLEVLHYHRVIVRANWKLFVETNGEGYHELLHLLNRTTGLSQPEYQKRRWYRHPRGHHLFAPAEIAYGRLALGERSEDTLSGMTPNGHVVVDLFPDAMINVRATVVRIDSLTPLAPDLTVLECRGLGSADDSPEKRDRRMRQHNQVWGPFGRNLPEDIWAIETQQTSMNGRASKYSLIAREEGDQATDDSPLRSYYLEWSRHVGRCWFDIDQRFPIVENGSVATERSPAE